MYRNQLIIFIYSFLLCIIIQVSYSANIFFFQQFCSYSHRIAVWPLVEELSNRGHNVTYHSIFHPKVPNPNITEFVPLEANDVFGFEENSAGMDLLNHRLNDGWPTILLDNVILPTYGLESCKKFLNLPAFVDFVENNKFDLVFIDALHNECGYGLAHKWGAKTIVYFTAHPTIVYGFELLGFLQTGESNWIPDASFVDAMPMTFYERILSLASTACMQIVREWYYYPALTQALRDSLKIPNMPTVKELVMKTDLAFYNSHFSEEMARSLPPMFIAVPALHAWGRKAKPLPNKIAEFINTSGEDGFIYVSFGSEADPASASEEFQNIFFDAFAKSKIQFLVRWTKKLNRNISDNIYTEEWMPQYDILASPKCKGFIGHGGLLGLQEATLNAVPMILLPVFAEQGYNAHRIERTGRGIQLEVRTLTVNQLTEAIHDIISNNKYKQNLLKVSKQLKDQLNTPIETAVYWTEYALRHNDLSALKPLHVRDHYWFQLYLLDIWIFLIVLVLMLCYCLNRIVHLTCAKKQKRQSLKQKSS